MTTNGLLDAASVLEDQAAGRVPDRARVLSGALALDTLRGEGVADRDILDAAVGIQLLATGRGLELDEIGRARAAHLAEVVRKAADAK
jgi:hypothetical protein